MGLTFYGKGVPRYNPPMHADDLGYRRIHTHRRAKEAKHMRSKQRTRRAKQRARLMFLVHQAAHRRDIFGLRDATVSVRGIWQGLPKLVNRNWTLPRT